MKRVLLVGLSLWVVTSGLGCSLAPKSFRDMIHPAPIVRARSVGFGEEQPEWVAVPAMIEQLTDPADVVRMTAHDALKARTRRDFGYVAWAPPEERAKAVERWRVWWKDRAAQAAYPKDDQLLKVSNRPDRPARKRRRKDPDGQGGPTASWPTELPASPSPDPAASPR